MRKFYIDILWRKAGLISFGWVYGENKSIDFHLFPSIQYWQWGYGQDWYDGPLPYLGLGPLLLICWLEWLEW